MLHFFGKTAQFVIAVEFRAVGPQRGDQDGNVIDFDGLHNPAADAGRNLIGIRVDLVVQFDERIFAILAHVEPNRDDAVAGPGHRVHVLDPVDLVQQLFQATRDLLLDFLGGQPRRADEHVRHRHDDLRFFLAGRQQQCHQAEQQRNDHQQNGDVAPQKDFHDPRQQRCLFTCRGFEVLCCHHPGSPRLALAVSPDCAAPRVRLPSSHLALRFVPACPAGPS